MTAPRDRWEQARELFESARALPPERRDAFLQETVADAALRDEVEILLRAHEAVEAGAGERFLDRLDGERASALLASAAEEEAEPDTEGLCPGELLGRYRIVRRLGHGGMGVVYLAHDERLARPAALKLLPRHLSLDDTPRRRFEEEARAASALDHPHIAAVYEIGEANGGRIFLAMAYYEGETLRQKLERGRLPTAEAVALAIQIGEGLAAAHARGIVHRDIKPANVIVTPEGGARIVDFGIAKIAGSVLTQTGVTLGTVAYMSPEQTRGDKVDALTDLWSLGVLLYEMLTGARPFRAVNEQALIYAIRHDEPEPIRCLRPEVPPTLARIVERCLRKNPAERHAGARALLADLRAWVTSPSARAANPRQVWRQPAVRFGSAVGALTLLLAGAIAFWPEAQSSDAEPVPPGTNAVDAPTRLAVLPLVNLSPGEDDAFFADGLTEELISQLSALQDLRVIARSSVLPYRGTEKSVAEIGRELGVGAVLAGSIHKVGDRIHIQVRLNDTRSQQPIWTEDYEDEIGQMPRLQREIARRVATELNGRAPGEAVRPLTRGETEDAGAYELYLRGRFLLSNLDAASFVRARDYFEQAVQRDPGFARAWSGLADAYDHLAGQSVLPSDEAYPRARAAAERALALDPELAEAHASLARALAWYFWDTEAAERHFRRAIELDPSDAAAHQGYAEYLRNLGRFDEALAEVQRAQELDPLTAYSHVERGIILYFAGRYDEALEQYQRLLHATPAANYTNIFIAMVHLQKGDHDTALASLQLMDSEERQPDALGVRGVVHARAGQPAEARRILARLDELAAQRPVPAFPRAAIHVHLGEHGRALDLLEQAVEERSWHVRMLKMEPIFAPLRPHPRFQALLQAVGLAG
jgi:TolB-like protein/Tfp pilus assembly protein PilF/predicted Ser/Thr protein kinase